MRTEVLTTAFLLTFAWTAVFGLGQFPSGCQALGAEREATSARPTLRTGDKAPPFKLSDHQGTPRSLDDWQDKPVVVVAFLGIECPLVRLYATRLQEIANDFADRGVVLVGINANQQDSLSELSHFVKENQLRFPFLKDVGNQVADQFGAERTPEVFVLDRERRVQYHGRIDDQYTYGKQKPRAEHRYLVDALESVLTQRPVATPETEIVGCHIGRLMTGQPNSDVTYSRQISRILNRRCVECHRPGEIAPFSLTNYAETVGWAEMIAEVVQERRMPPWHADPAHGQFANDARLTDEERSQIGNWVAAGAPEGDPKDLPPTPQFVTGWRIGQPDLIVKMATKPYTVPATGEVKYQYFVVDPGFKEDKWVKAAECRPGNRSVVHHIIVAAGSRERVAQRFNDEVVSDWLTATAPGARPMILPAGMAKKIPAGSKIIFQMHYTPNGLEQQDLSSVGLIFADPKEVTREVATQKAANPRFRIPPGAANHRVEADYRFEEDTLMLAMFPHMHLRGKAFSYTAYYPDGRSEILLDIPRYDFNWQNSYEFSEPKRMPAGTRLHCVAHYDNSSENWANPDPTQTVRWGDQTWEEMMIGYFDMTPVRSVSATASANSPTESPLALFSRQWKDQPLKLPESSLKLAPGSLESHEAWERYGMALVESIPQLDRMCWITFADGKARVERAVARQPGRRTGGEGTVVPATGLLLAKYAEQSQTVSHEDIGQLLSPDFRLFARAFSSSFHVPVQWQGKRGVVSFWSKTSKGFPEEAQSLLLQATKAVQP